MGRTELSRSVWPTQDVTHATHRNPGAFLPAQDGECQGEGGGRHERALVEHGDWRAVSLVLQVSRWCTAPATPG